MGTGESLDGAINLAAEEANVASEAMNKTAGAADRAEGRVLAINPGTTSTKIGTFTRAGEEFTRNIHHGDDEIERFKGRPMLRE